MIKFLFACILISPFALAHAPCTTVAEAKSVAEFETQGEAVDCGLTRIHLRS